METTTIPCPCGQELTIEEADLASLRPLQSRERRCPACGIHLVVGPTVSAIALFCDAAAHDEDEGEEGVTCTTTRVEAFSTPFYAGWVRLNSDRTQDA